MFKSVLNETKPERLDVCMFIINALGRCSSRASASQKYSSSHNFFYVDFFTTQYLQVWMSKW